MGKFAIKSSERLGRYLVATTTIQPGALVLEDQPYAAVLYDDQTPLRCDYCYTTSDSLMRCSKSKLARYCSRQHQSLAWKAGFKLEADALAKLHPRVPPPSLRLAARTIWRHLRAQEAGQAEGPHAGYADILQLQHHWGPLPDDKKGLYAQMAIVVREYLLAGGTPEEKLPEAREVALLLARFACNNHTICDEELRPVGVGIYPLAAIANHNCRPSCSQSFKGSSIVFRAVRPIQPGEEITISYIELAATRRDRRSQLLAMYHFDIDAPPTPSPHPSPNATAKPSQPPNSITAPSPATAPLEPQHTSSINGIGTSCDVLDTGLASGAQACSATQGPACQADYGSQKVAVAGAVAPAATIALQPSGDILRLYHCLPGGRPPWPCDEADVVATELMLRGGHASSKRCGLVAWPASQRPCTGEPGAGSSTAVDNDYFSDMMRDHQEACDMLQNQQQAINKLRDHQEASSSTAAAPGAGAGPADGKASTSAATAAAAEPVQIAVDCWVRAGEGSGAVLHALEEVAGGMAAALQQVLEAEQQAGLGHHAAAIGLLQDALAAMDGGPAQRGRLGAAHVLRMRANAALMKAAIDHGESWEVALQAAEKLLVPYQHLYPKVWPNLGLHWAAVAKLQSFIGILPAALRAAREAIQILGITHPGTVVLHDMQQLAMQLQHEMSGMQHQQDRMIEDDH